MKRVSDFFKEIYSTIQIHFSGYFDHEYYQTQYPDVKAAGINPILHYLKFGGLEGRNPSLKFESSFYLHTYPDVKEAGMNPLLHYIRFGKRERRMPVDLGGVNIRPIPAWRYYCNEFINVFSNHKVSVIVPSYNACHTIVICLKSLIQQKYTNIEIIVVDDGSEDRSGQLIEKIARLDPRVKYVRLVENMGKYVALNEGIRRSSGKYITMHGADDISLSTRIEKQMQVIRKHKVLFVLCLFVRSELKMEELDAEDKVIIHRLTGRSDLYTIDTKHTNLKLQICLPGMLANKKLFRKHNLFWEARYAADTEYLERILYHEMNISFPKDYSGIYQFFIDLRFQHKLYYFIYEVLYISSVRNANNLTMKYPMGGEERMKFIEQWRRRLRREIEYEYPVL